MIHFDRSFGKYQTGGFTGQIGQVNSVKKMVICKNLICHIVQISFEAGLDPIQDFKDLRHSGCVFLKVST